MQTMGESVWAEAPVRLVDVRFNYLASQAGSNPALHFETVTTQEKLTTRLTALEVTNYSAGKTSVSFGGNLLTNWFTAGVNYQTLYVPLRPTNPFTQALAVNVQINLLGNIHLNTATSFDAAGKMYYTLAGTDSYYRMSGLEAAPQSAGFRLKQLVVQGQVTTPDGLPVYGAAVHIAKEVLYTDRDGRFEIRVSKPGPYTVEVAVGEFLDTGTYKLVSAPESVTATKDESAPGIKIVVKRE
jgi:hypothetical protein